MAVRVPLPQNIPLLEADAVTVGLVLTVAETELEVTESQETLQVIIHL